MTPGYTYWVLGIVLCGLVAFAVLLVLPAPYGRHRRAGWGPEIGARWGWLIMELPSPLGFALAFASSSRASEALPLVFLALWMLHYVHRSLIYPWRLRAQGKTMPLVTVGLAVIFNALNGPLNGYAVTEAAPHLDASWSGDPRFVAGLLIFLLGFAINQHGDRGLRRLRQPGDLGYAVPRGGLFRWVSCPNYLGECLEWTGYALASWTLAGAAFAWFTCANLIPRALAHHRWYRREFPDYPPERRALIPFLF